MNVCHKCDIAYKNGICPLCLKEEENSLLDKELKKLLVLKDGTDSDLAKAKKEVQLDIVNQTINHLSRSLVLDSDTEKGILFCIKKLEKLKTRLQTEICEKEGEKESTRNSG